MTGKQYFPYSRVRKSENRGATFPYIRITVAHGLPEVGIHTSGVGVLDLGLGAHLWRGDMLHTHVHKACGGRRESHYCTLSWGKGVGTSDPLMMVRKLTVRGLLFSSKSYGPMILGRSDTLFPGHMLLRDLESH